VESIAVGACQPAREQEPSPAMETYKDTPDSIILVFDSSILQAAELSIFSSRARPRLCGLPAWPVITECRVVGLVPQGSIESSCPFWVNCPTAALPFFVRDLQAQARKRTRLSILTPK
jgi:hypothetical protein